jgi:hypothetical protein
MFPAVSRRQIESAALKRLAAAVRFRPRVEAVPGWDYPEALERHGAYPGLPWTLIERERGRPCCRKFSTQLGKASCLACTLRKGKFFYHFEYRSVGSRSSGRCTLSNSFCGIRDMPYNGKRARASLSVPCSPRLAQPASALTPELRHIRKRRV